MALLAAAAVLAALAPGSLRAASFTSYGAAGSIGGSCHLVDTGGARFLLDCGSFLEPGPPERDRTLPFAADSIDYVLLSHAHLDHSGRLPLLYRLGYRGSVLAAVPTRALCEVMLPMQLRIQRTEGHQTPVGSSDVEAALANFRELAFGAPLALAGGAELLFHPAGHILGSAMIELRYGPPDARRTLVFSGDFGHPGGSILVAKPRLARADTLIIESTYGAGRHGDWQAERERFYGVLREAAAEGGLVVIPCFVLARTQKVLAVIHQGIESGRVPAGLDVYVASPSAARLTRIYAEHEGQLAPELRTRIAAESSPFAFPGLHLGGRLGRLRRPAVVIVPASGLDSGAAAGLLARAIEQPDTRVCFVSSYQEPGSLSGELAAGAAEVEILGQRRSVRGRVYEFGSFSDHGDQAAILDWLAGFEHVGQVLVVHGEPASSAALAAAIRARFGWPVEVPSYGRTYALP